MLKLYVNVKILFQSRKAFSRNASRSRTSDIKTTRKKQKTGDFVSSSHSFTLSSLSSSSLLVIPFFFLCLFSFLCFIFIIFRLYHTVFQYFRLFLIIVYLLISLLFIPSYIVLLLHISFSFTSSIFFLQHFLIFSVLAHKTAWHSARQQTIKGRML
jgi:membrane-associated HD superfamily phosphohydrolase